jgi:hypothetical protein
MSGAVEKARERLRAAHAAHAEAQQALDSAKAAAERARAFAVAAREQCTAVEEEKVLNETDLMSDRFLGELWPVVRASASVWAGRVAALIADGDAPLELSFDAPAVEAAKKAA